MINNNKSMVNIDVNAESIEVKYPEKAFLIPTQHGTNERNGVSIRELIVSCIEKLRTSSDISRPDPFTIAAIGHMNMALAELTKRHFERKKHIVRRVDSQVRVDSDTPDLDKE